MIWDLVTVFWTRMQGLQMPLQQQVKNFFTPLSTSVSDPLSRQSEQTKALLCLLIWLSVVLLNPVFLFLPASYLILAGLS